MAILLEAFDICLPAVSKASVKQLETSASEFVYVTCQVEANAAVKAEVARDRPLWRLAFSRPGFLTFKLPADTDGKTNFPWHSTFARAYGLCLGKVAAEDLEAGARQVWEIAGTDDCQAVHVWERDSAMPGQGGFQPGITPQAAEMRKAILQVTSSEKLSSQSRTPATQPASPGQKVLDCILVEPRVWWIGHHEVGSFMARWPGGMMPIELPEDAVSRAYLKMEESLAWSRLPVGRDDPCVELGSAPGGASQALLRHGLIVNGIDPADMDPLVVADSNFRHIKKRGADLKRREYAGIRWLMADMNVAPKYTLDTVEQIVTHKSVNIRGMLLTLKLLEWQLADQVPAFLDRVRSWGYRDVRARQLANNRQEICIAALKHRSMRRVGKNRSQKA